MASSRCLAIDCNDVGFAIPQCLDPAHETGFEELAVERIDHIIERVMGRKAALIR